MPLMALCVHTGFEVADVIVCPTLLEQRGGRQEIVSVGFSTAAMQGGSLSTYHNPCPLPTQLVLNSFLWQAAAGTFDTDTWPPAEAPFSSQHLIISH